MKRAARAQRQSRGRNDLILSLLLNQNRLMCLCLPPPIMSRDWHYRYMLYCFWCRKNMFFSPIVIALLSFTVYLCWFSELSVGVWKRKRESDGVWISNNMLSSAPRFSERILTKCIIKGTDSIALCDLVNLLSQTRTLYKACTHTRPLGCI